MSTVQGGMDREFDLIPSWRVCKSRLVRVTYKHRNRPNFVYKFEILVSNVSAFERYQAYVNKYNVKLQRLNMLTTNCFRRKLQGNTATRRTRLC